MTIDISPEAVERLACILEGRGGFVKDAVVVATLRALSASRKEKTMSEEVTGAVWRARSASDKTDDWPYWYVTKDMPADYNATSEVVKALIGVDMVSPPFLPKDIAILIAAEMNEINKGDK